MRSRPDFLSELIPPEWATRMPGVSWHPGCPVAIADLRLLQVAHLRFDGTLGRGRIVVHEAVAEDVLAIFQDLLAAGFPLARVEPIEAFSGSDALSMAANNSSGFNCRANATTGVGFSVHSYGLAIDLNPVQNPYAKPEVDATGKLLQALSGCFDPPRVEPEAGRNFLDRRQPRPGMIRLGDAVHGAFARRGWTWGGEFQGRTDYQHFETAPERFGLRR